MTIGIILATLTLVSVFSTILTQYAASKGAVGARKALLALPVAMLALNLISAAAAFAMSDGQKNTQGNPDKIKIEQFRREVEPLRNRMHSLREETERLVESDNPNWDKVLANEIELAKIKVAMQQSAKKYGLPASPRKIREVAGSFMQGGKGMMQQGNMPQHMNSQWPQ